MKIRIIASAPIDGQEDLNSYIGREYETVDLKKHYEFDRKARKILRNQCSHPDKITKNKRFFIIRT